jgi:hypothetical protein
MRQDGGCGRPIGLPFMWFGPAADLPHTGHRGAEKLMGASMATIVGLRNPRVDPARRPGFRVVRGRLTWLGSFIPW